MKTGARLGLTGALALLAACGPAKPIQEAGDEGDGDTESGVDMPPGAMCTLENYADDPQLTGFAGVGCFPVEPDGSCAACDLECMESIVFTCPLEGCESPDFPCIDNCVDHLLLCSEQLGDQCCHLVTASGNSGVVPGRPLRERGLPRLPRLAVVGPASDDSERRLAADCYREFARYERSSVDAFIHAALLLERLGAPPELIDGQREAAREEAGHARLALAAAQALDGRAATLGELPPITVELDLERFVCDLIHDGCIGERIATREAAWALDQACVREHAALRAYWMAVIDEEASHAALAWQTLEWLLVARPELGPLVNRELAAAVGPRASVRPADHDAFGLPAATTQLALRELAIDELVAEARQVAALG
jgi:hypothetical protein